MSKVTKKELKSQLDGVQNRFAALVRDLKASGYICESVYAPFAHDYQKEQSDYDELITILDSKEPQLKQLDQSIFNGLDEKWRWVARDHNGDRYAYAAKPYARDATGTWVNNSDLSARYLDAGYDDENWQNSLIERDTEKELLEVDLSSELTGSDLARAMLARGDRFILCGVSDVDDSDAANHESIDFLAEAATDFDCKDELFGTASMRWRYAVPINNQGEPLTASEVGL